MRVYHLLPAEWALKDLERKRLKISFLEDLNDPFEFLALDTSDAIVGHALGATRFELGQTSGVLCFSRTWSNPVLWSHYGDKHKGIALGFNIPELIAGDRPWFDVTYIRERLTCTVEELSSWGTSDVNKLLSTKFEHWAYEDEVRIFTSIQEKDEQTGLCFAPFSESLELVEVVRGVRCTASPLDIHRSLGDLSPRVKVVEGRLDERSFSVIEKHA